MELVEVFWNVLFGTQLSGMNQIQVRELKSLPDQTAGREIFDIVWPVVGGTEIMPNLMQAFVYSGAYFVGAFEGKKIVGATFGFIGTVGGIHLHSHMAAVLPEFRDRGTGTLMKRHQFGWAYENNVPFITWTFDPLVKRNAKLNIVKLGIEVASYHPNFYGVMPDLNNAGDDSDRLMAKWIVGRNPPNGKPITTTIGDDAITISIPEDVLKLRKENLVDAKSVRVRVRQQFQAAFREGYKVLGFSEEVGYVLVKGAI